MDDLVKLSDVVLIDGSDCLEVSDVSVHGLLGVICFAGDGGGEVALEIEGDDLPFMGQCAGEVVDIASGGQDSTCCSLIFIDILTDGGVADTQQDGQV